MCHGDWVMASQHQGDERDVYEMALIALAPRHSHVVAEKNRPQRKQRRQTDDPPTMPWCEYWVPTRGGYLRIACPYNHPIQTRHKFMSIGLEYACRACNDYFTIAEVDGEYACPALFFFFFFFFFFCFFGGGGGL
jgi:hypothetical protein